MKTNYLLIIYICLLNVSVFAQQTRVEIQGKVVVDRNDVEGIAVYNKSSQKGTVTDAEGRFTLEVALEDKVQFSALQFEDFEIEITDDVIETKEMTVFLVEQINKLDEVLILPHNLTGDLSKDLSNVALVNPNLDALYFGLDNLDKIDFSEDHLSEVKNIAMPKENHLEYGVNMVDVVGLLLSAIFKNDEKKIREPYIPVYKQKKILDIYTIEYLKKILNTKDDNIKEFVYFVEEDNFDISLLESKREFEFIEHIKAKHQEFVKIKYGRE